MNWQTSADGRRTAEQCVTQPLKSGSNNDKLRKNSYENTENCESNSRNTIDDPGRNWVRR